MVRSSSLLFWLASRYVSRCCSSSTIRPPPPPAMRGARSGRPGGGAPGAGWPGAAGGAPGGGGSAAVTSEAVKIPGIAQIAAPLVHVLRDVFMFIVLLIERSVFSMQYSGCRVQQTWEERRNHEIHELHEKAEKAMLRDGLAPCFFDF